MDKIVVTKAVVAVVAVGVLSAGWNSAYLMHKMIGL